MGATDLTMEIKGKSERTLQAAFKKRVKADKAYYGNDPYSGSWANVDRVKVVYYPDAPKRWTDKSKWAALRWLGDHRVEKYGPALAIKTTNSYLVCACVAT